MSIVTKSTGDLLDELKDGNSDIERYLDKNSDSFINTDLKSFWTEAVNKSGMNNCDIINKSDFGYVYFYDVVNGRKIPSQDKIVRLVLAMKLSLDDCQSALKICGHSHLYPRIKRDSIIIHSIVNQLSVYETSELLLRNNERGLK